MFSVVIPVFNHEAYLEEAVLSASRAALVTEILLFDDGSSDGSHHLIRQLSRCSEKIRDLTTEPRLNRGTHVCLNALVQQASNEWIAVLNSDDVFVHGRFEAVARHIHRTGADFIFG